MVLETPALKAWTKSQAIYPKNNIVSSEWGLKGRKCHFHPSYNCEEKSDIKKLLSMEYARIWYYEQQGWADKYIIIDPQERRQKEWNKKVLEARKAKKLKEKQDKIEKEKSKNKNAKTSDNGKENCTCSTDVKRK